MKSIRVTIDDQGKVASAQDYYAYGEVIEDRSYNNSSPNERYNFTEKERDTETKYDYFGARYYNSEIGRWLAVDPLADKYPGLSPYNYVANNPVLNFDPNGMYFQSSSGRKFIRTSQFSYSMYRLMGGPAYKINPIVGIGWPFLGGAINSIDPSLSITEKQWVVFGWTMILQRTKSFFASNGAGVFTTLMGLARFGVNLYSGDKETRIILGNLDIDKNLFDLASNIGLGSHVSRSLILKPWVNSVKAKELLLELENLMREEIFSIGKAADELSDSEWDDVKASTKTRFNLLNSGSNPSYNKQGTMRDPWYIP